MSRRSDPLAREFRPVFANPRLESLTREHGGAVDAWAESAGMDADDLLDFSASINPLGPPPAARMAFFKSYGQISRYPEVDGKKLKAALAERHGMNSAEVLLGNGSTQLIYLLCAALRPRHVLIVDPAFSEYANALTLIGAAVRRLTLTADDNFQFSLQRFMSAWDKDVDMVFIATPNSVTGRRIAKIELESLACAALTRKRFVVVDEAFIDFVESESVKTTVRRNPYLIVLRSLTKYYALPGLRLGYLLSETDRIAQLAAYREPWSVNGPALNVALACLDDASFRAKTEVWLQRERQFLSKRVAAIDGLHPLPSEANFLLVRIDRTHGDALRLRSFLLSRKILIRACDSFGLGVGYFRVAVKQRKDNRRLIAALKEWSARNG